MAEKPTDKTKRRVVRNPDTFRERAQKATEVSDKPSKAGNAANALTRPFRPIIAAIRRSLAWKVIRRILRFIVPTYFVNSWRELKLVTWPGWKQSRQLTGAVLIFAVVFGAVIALVDFGLDKLFKNILLK
jgi:preprotein translocase SecE subunit